jgi:site-specific recombinase XerD
MKSKLFIITGAKISAYLLHLAREERAAATVEKYARDLRAFKHWLNGRPVTKEKAIAYKQRMSETPAPASVNAAVAALNGFFAFQGWDIKVKYMKIQRQTFLHSEKELTKAEYQRLLLAAKRNENERLHLVMQAICSTGIRVSELKFITVETARARQALITNKGKSRMIFIPKKLKPLLLAYAKKKGIKSGCIFITKSGRPLGRKNIWADMKKLCESAQVAPSKVFPHNLRHLFARVFYSVEKDVMRLADLLGHSDVKTTRLYIMDSGAKHRKLVDALGLAAG